MNGCINVSNNKKGVFAMWECMLKSSPPSIATLPTQTSQGNNADGHGMVICSTSNMNVNGHVCYDSAWYGMHVTTCPATCICKCICGEKAIGHA